MRFLFAYADDVPRRMTAVNSLWRLTLKLNCLSCLLPSTGSLRSFAAQCCGACAAEGALKAPEPVLLVELLSPVRIEPAWTKRGPTSTAGLYPPVDAPLHWCGQRRGNAALGFCLLQARCGLWRSMISHLPRGLARPSGLNRTATRWRLQEGGRNLFLPSDFEC